MCDYALYKSTFTFEKLENSSADILAGGEGARLLARS